MYKMTDESRAHDPSQADRSSAEGFRMDGCPFQVRGWILAAHRHGGTGASDGRRGREAGSQGHVERSADKAEARGRLRL